MILLDEVEKAHSDIWDIFLQVLDDGRLTDNKGRTIDFSNTLIILTSNLKKDELSNYFKVEFLNRISSIVTFESLNRNVLENIVEKQLNELSSKLEANKIELAVKEDLFNFIVDKACENKSFGARPIKRFIKEYLESVISKKILEDDSLKGSALVIGLKDIGSVE